MHCHRQTIVRANSNKQGNRRTWSKLDVSAMPCTVGTIGGVRLRSTKPAQSKPYHGNWISRRISIIEKKHKRVIISKRYIFFLFILYLCVRVHDRSKGVRNFTMFWESLELPSQFHNVWENLAILFSKIFRIIFEEVIAR